MRVRLTILACVPLLLARCTTKDIGGPGADNGSGATSTTTDSSDAAGDSASSLTGSTGSSASTTTTATATESTATSATQDSGSGQDASASESTTAGEPVCETHEQFTCSVPYANCPWGSVDCGDVNSWFDEHGCLRRECWKTGECPDGMRCHRPYEACGRCAEINITCEDFVEDGMVECICSGGDGDCNGAFCLPEDEFPEGFCGER